MPCRSGRRITYGQFFARTRRVAKLLLHLGVRRGDRVVMLSPARDEYMYVYVAMVTVIPIPHEIFQEVGKAFVMPRPGTQVTAEELEALCREHLANYKVPKSFEVRPLLPMLLSGKVNRMALVEEERVKRG